ncbi:MAG: C10 family peptidase, partial [Bacteroidota bacterium]
MKSLVCLLAGILAVQSVVSQTVTTEEAAEYAANVLYYHYGIAERENPQLIHTYREEQNPVYYTFTTDDAFVIISAEKSYLPVLAHSSEGGLPSDPDRLPPAFVEWMNSLAEDITAVRNGQLSIDEEKLQTWDIVETRQPGPQQTRGVSPLLSTTWNQGCGYNGMCPVDASGPCNHVYTGCVATTQAQVMKYHAHPASGIGNECYTHSDYGELCADYAAANYDWAAMPNNSGSAEVEELMYHCGVSVSMNYSPSGSGSYLSRVDNALRDHFDYTTNLDEVSRYHFDPADWDDLMRKECDAGRVMAYKGTGSGGHAFVLDGYNDFGEFHFNWGWGGTADGYYVMGNLNPSGHDYSGSNAAIIGVEPATDFSGMDFSGITTLGCGITQPVDLSTGISEVNVYGNANIDAVGKEKVYEFTTSLPGRITINLENPSNEISAILLSHQHRDSVLSYGTNGLIYDNSTPATYYLVLDVAHAQNATADLELICPTADPDLIAQNVQVIPNTIESNQTGVIMKSTIKNIGNSASAACDMEYYLSDNDTLDGGDLLIASTTIPILNAGDDTIVESIHTMPVLPVAGYYYVFGVPDASNTVVETVEDD